MGEAAKGETKKADWVGRGNRAGVVVRRWTIRFHAFAERQDGFGRIVLAVAGLGLLLSLAWAFSTLSHHYWPTFDRCSNYLTIATDYAGNEGRCYGDVIGQNVGAAFEALWTFVYTLLFGLLRTVVVIAALLVGRWIVAGFRNKAS